MGIWIILLYNGGKKFTVFVFNEKIFYFKLNKVILCASFRKCSIGEMTKVDFFYYCIISLTTPLNCILESNSEIGFLERRSLHFTIKT